MKIFARSLVFAGCIAGVSGCGVAVRNHSADILNRNASGIYPIQMEVRKGSNAVLDRSIRAEIVVGGKSTPMTAVTPLPEEGRQRWMYSINVPATQSEVYYHFLVNYQVEKISFRKPFDSLVSKQRLSPDGAPDQKFVLKIRDRIATGLDSERGRVGSTISVLGKGFTADDKVRVGGSLVPATFKDSSVVKFQIPQITPDTDHPVEVVGLGDDIIKAGKIRVDSSELTFSPTPCVLVLGAKAAVALRLPNPAPSGGLSITLTASNPSLADLPAQVSVKEGSKEVVIKTTGTALGKGTITVDALGFRTATVPILVVENP